MQTIQINLPVGLHLSERVAANDKIAAALKYHFGCYANEAWGHKGGHAEPESRS